MGKFDMVDAVMSYLDKYQFSGSHNYKDVLETFKQIGNDYRNDEGAFKDCDDDVFDYDEFAKELYERDKSCKDIRSALAALFIDSEGNSYRAGREFETDTQYHGWRHNTWPISFETDMNGITVQVPLSSYFDAHFKNKYGYDKDDYALLYPFLNNGAKVTSELSEQTGVPKEDYYRLALDYAGGSFDDNSWVNACDDVTSSVVGNVLADYYYNKGCEVAQDVATKIAYSGKDIKDISVQDFYEMTKDIRKDVMAMDDNINDLYGDVTLWRSEYYSYDENAKLSERFAGCYELGLLNFDNSGKLNACLSECLSPRRSFKLSESRTEHTDSPLLLDNVADVEFQGPNFCGYNITFERDWYKCDKQAAKDMREFCDYESKESETTVSRKTLHVPEVAEDDKDLEY